MTTGTASHRGALERAAKQGLKVEHLLTLLARHAEAGIPAPVTKALRRWEQAGTEARTENQVVLRVNRPEIIKELRDHAPGGSWTAAGPDGHHHQGRRAGQGDRGPGRTRHPRTG